VQGDLDALRALQSPKTSRLRIYRKDVALTKGEAIPSHENLPVLAEWLKLEHHAAILPELKARLAKLREGRQAP
jgi:hypothetical protein